jgi:DNA topoisomerase-2
MTSVAQTYKKHTHREHILSLPDTYIGSIETAPEEAFIVENEKFVLKNLNGYNPGFYKLFDELLVNAHDHVIRTRQREAEHLVKNIKISISADNQTICVENDGEGIDVEMHPTYGVYAPQLVFGELLTSTNYDKEEKKLVGGKNGYGVKLANIFAKEFTVETVDAKRSKKYVQTFRNNMTVIETPKITSSKVKPYVSVSWTPDFEKFKMTSIPADMIAMFRRRASDLAMTVGKEVKIHWQYGEDKHVLKCRDLGVYAGEYVDTPVVYAQINERWSVAVADTPVDKFMQVSFVNGIWTSKGGTHVDYITYQIVTHLMEYLEAKKKVKAKTSLVKDHLAVFVNCLIENPSFNSQTKETLTTKSNAFGSSCRLPEDFLKKIQTKLNLVDSIVEAQREKDEKENKKSDGRKQSKIHGIPKLEDAALAGTSKSASCTLILTEGDSAKTMALSGLSAAQRSTFGVFPLRGKVLNVKDTAASKIELTKEIAELKKILGLESGRKYKNISELRYGSILIMTDQDYDGSHIRGLLINLFHELWHELMEIPGFITYMATPIVKATKGAQTKSFFTQYEYEQWRKSDEVRGWKVKYYKGLGTSTRSEAQDYFKQLTAMKFQFTPESDEAIDLAFNKSRADDRKEWLLRHDPSHILLPHPDFRLPYDEFVHRDLVHFSYYNLERAIPNVMDGLKTSQRKILYGALKRNLKSEIRVAQFAGYVSEHAGYHHGEASLNETIIGMAQDFTGANNISWFVPQGQFGTRLEGGKDAASPRYIHTYLSAEVQNLVPQDDLPILTYRDDDGLPVEPLWYAPILPMILVNGATGIGTGFSTDIPQYNPNDLYEILRGWLDTQDDKMIEQARLIPWSRGFKGTIVADEKGGYLVKGVWSYDARNKRVSVRELPVGTWTSKFKEMLSGYEEKREIVKDFTDMSTDTDVHFDIVLMSDMTPEQIEKTFGLSSRIKLSNMHLFDPSGHIRKYVSANEILLDYARKRLEMYGVRKEFLLRDFQSKLPYHENVVRFIQLQTQDVPQPDLRKKTRAECDTLLGDVGLVKIDGSFDYLLSLPISSLTAETAARHAKQLADLRSKIDQANKTTPTQMWVHDLSVWKDSKSKK